MKKQKIYIITTGGTIEKSYNEFDGSLQNRTSLLKTRMLSKLRLPHTDVIVEELMAKDSLHMDDQDRKAILKSIQDHLPHKAPILVLHGTDTMEVSARFCQENLPDLQVPVIFTGAMKPQGFEDSDATQNFIEALMACHLARPGVYISFHNCLFPAGNVTKNRRRRTFEEKL